jgi:lysozyme family protein
MLEKLIDDVLVKEGGFVDHPNDRGGPTNYGITIHTLSAYLGKPVTRQDVYDLDKNLAREIYKANYYKAPQLDRLPEAIQPQLFDMCVNHGSRNAIRMMQRVIKQAEISDISVDGANGPQTFSAAQTAQARMGLYFNNAIVDERINFYNAIVARNSSQQVFLRGWIRRAKSFYLEAA